MKLVLVSFFCFITAIVSSQSVGTKVKMLAADGKEYTGVIKEINGENFRVKYDGADFEAWILSTQFTVINKTGGNTVPQNTGYKVGDKIIAKDDVNNLLEAEIIAIADGKYKVHYAGYNDWKDAWITADRIKLLNSNATATNNPTTVAQNNNTKNTGTQNTGYKVGDKITAKDKVNNWLPAEIMEIGNGKYKVHYTGWSDLWDDWIPSDWIKPLNSKPATNNSTTELPKDPEMNGAIPKIIGTAWYCLAIYNKGTTPTNNHIHTPYIFFKNGRFEFQNSFVTMGKYRVSGNKLTQVADGSDNLTETYTISWNAKNKYMELTSTSGPTVLRLTYNRNTTQ